MTNIHTRTLGEICDEIGGTIRTGPFGSQLHMSDYLQEGTPVVMPKDISNGRISIEDIARIGYSDVSRLSQHKLMKGDIIYGRRGDIGRRALITDKENGWVCGTGCLRISLGDTILDPTFLYYYLGQPAVIKSILNQAVGATMPNLNTTIIRNIPITYPHISIQQKIAYILSSCDNLIENNSLRIKILEEMAQIIYNEWFVKFRFPGHENVKMVESELGMMPEGWEIANLSKEAKFIRGIEPGSKNYLNQPDKNTIPFYRVGDLGSRSSNTFIKKEHSKQKLVTEEDILLSLDGTVGRVRMGLSGSYSTGIRKVDINDKSKLGKAFVYCLLKSDRIQEIINAHAKGTTIIHASSSIDYMNFMLPPSLLVKEFEILILPLLKSTLILSRKTEKLEMIRDLLLPRLISGKIDVSELDIDVGGITA